MSEIKKNIQKNIAEYRKQANLTQKELAERLGVKTTSLASWEQGKSMPDIDTLFSLCSILGTNIITISGFEPPERHHQYGDGWESSMADLFTTIDAMNNYSAMVGKELSMSSDEQQLVTDYRSLNDQGQEYIRQTMYMAKQTYKKMPDVSDMEHQA